MYGEPDGWYDHRMGPIVNPSASIRTNASNEDQFDAAGKCGNGGPLADGNGNALGEHCGYGPRLPLVVISPWAKENFVEHTVTSRTSATRFIGDNWKLARLGNGSLGEVAGPTGDMVDFDDRSFGRADGQRAPFFDARTGQPSPH